MFMPEPPRPPAEYITHENVLDLLESFTRRMKSLTNPCAHPYDDPARAKPYEAHYLNARRAWLAVKNGEDPVTVIRQLHSKIHGGEQNSLNLYVLALTGKFERADTWFGTLPCEIEHHWVTNEGDFYGVRNGDPLNLGSVERIANKDMPSERINIKGSQRLAGLMPNHCTRVIHPVQFH